MKKKIKYESIWGFFAIIAWCIISAAAYVFTGHIEESIDSTLLCFGIFFCSMIFFITSNYKKTSLLKIKLKGNLKSVILINIMTFGCWFLTIYPLKFIEPSIVNSVVLGILPIGTLGIGTLLYGNKNTAFSDYLISSLLFLGILFLGLVCFKKKSAVEDVTLQNVIIAFFSCLGGGISLAINNIYTKQLSNKGFTSFDILSIRFILITIVTGILSFSMLNNISNLEMFLDILIAAISLIILPQIIFQYSLRELEPITISIVAPLMPVLIFFIEYYNKNLHPTLWTIAGVSYICGISIIGAMMRYKKIQSST